MDFLLNEEYDKRKLKDLDRVSKLKDIRLGIPEKTKGIVKFKDTVDKPVSNNPETKLPPIDDVLKNKQKLRFLPYKDYDMNDVVNIVTPNAKFKSVYMGIEGSDSVDILDTLNKDRKFGITDTAKSKFEKANPFDGVFVLFAENLPKSFEAKKIRIFLLNENEVGKGSKQRIKAYTNDGKFITKYDVMINNIELVNKQEMPHKLAASLRIPSGPSLLERINSEEFQNFINMTTNEVVKYNDFSTDIDFEEVK